MADSDSDDCLIVGETKAPEIPFAVQAQTLKSMGFDREYDMCNGNIPETVEFIMSKDFKPPKQTIGISPGPSSTARGSNDPPLHPLVETPPDRPMKQEQQDVDMPSVFNANRVNKNNKSTGKKRMRSVSPSPNPFAKVAKMNEVVGTAAVNQPVPPPSVPPSVAVENGLKLVVGHAKRLKWERNDDFQMVNGEGRVAKSADVQTLRAALRFVGDLAAYNALVEQCKSKVLVNMKTENEQILMLMCDNWGRHPVIAPEPVAEASSSNDTEVDASSSSNAKVDAASGASSSKDVHMSDAVGIGNGNVGNGTNPLAGGVGLNASAPVVAAASSSSASASVSAAKPVKNVRPRPLKSSPKSEKSGTQKDEIEDQQAARKKEEKDLEKAKKKALSNERLPPEEQLDKQKPLCSPFAKTSEPVFKQDDQTPPNVHNLNGHTPRGSPSHMVKQHMDVGNNIVVLRSFDKQIFDANRTNIHHMKIYQYYPRGQKIHDHGTNNHWSDVLIAHRMDFHPRDNRRYPYTDLLTAFNKARNDAQGIINQYCHEDYERFAVDKFVYALRNRPRAEAQFVNFMRMVKYSGFSIFNTWKHVHSDARKECVRAILEERLLGMDACRSFAFEKKPGDHGTNYRYGTNEMPLHADLSCVVDFADTDLGFIGFNLRFSVSNWLQRHVFNAYWNHEMHSARWGLFENSADTPMPEDKPKFIKFNWSTAKKSEFNEFGDPKAPKGYDFDMRGDQGCGFYLDEDSDSSGDEEETNVIRKDIFQMKNSLDMIASPTPACFKTSPVAYKLKGNQPFSLSWMYAREGRCSHGHPLPAEEQPEPFMFTEKHSHPFFGSGKSVVFKAEFTRSFPQVRGGILGDTVGYGKTACMIAMISQTQADARQHFHESITDDWEKKMCSDLLITPATLIVFPNNLLNQWEAEIEKFVDHKKQYLKVIKIRNHTDMKKYKNRDFMQADVVLVHEKFYKSGAYQMYFDALAYDVEPWNLVKKKQEQARERKRDQWKRQNPNKSAHENPHRHGTSSASCTSEAYKKIKADDFYLCKRLAKLRQKQAKLLKDKDASALKKHLDEPALFEGFYWHRVCFDEFHEVVSLSKLTSKEFKLNYYQLCHLQARFRWGLTATPLLRSPKEVEMMAALLHVYIPLKCDEELQQQHSQQFVDFFMRSNPWDTESIPLIPQTIYVTHTTAERALYLHQQHVLRAGRDGEEGGAGNQSASVKEKNKIRLLKLCTHFAPDFGDEVTDDVSAIDRTRENNRRQYAEAEEGLVRVQANLDLLVEKRFIQPNVMRFLKKVALKDYPLVVYPQSQNMQARKLSTYFFPALTDAGRSNKFKDQIWPLIMAHSPIELLKTFASEGVQPRPREPAAPVTDETVKLLQDELVRVQTPGVYPQHHGPAAQHAFQQHGYFSNCQECYRHGDMEASITANHAKITQYTNKKNSLDSALAFLDKTVNSLVEEQKRAEMAQARAESTAASSSDKPADGPVDEENTCSFCLDELDPPESVLTQCCHAFHEECIMQVINDAKKNNVDALCPICRNVITKKDLTHFKDLPGVKKETATEDKKENVKDLAGSKMNAIAAKLKSILQKQEKTLVFIQWDELQKVLVTTLEERLGFKPLLLTGSSVQRARVLEQFKTGHDDQDNIMVLSLEGSTTGMDLTCANHCVLVHPMHADASKGKDASAYEHQAIGRVRRQGQERAVYVYRFVTKGTIEEEISKEHERALEAVRLDDAAKDKNKKEASSASASASASSRQPRTKTKIRFKVA